MGRRIRNLTSTIFCRERLADTRSPRSKRWRRASPHLSRTELAHTACLRLVWISPSGRNRPRFAQRVLAGFERRNILLPAGVPQLQTRATSAVDRVAASHDHRWQRRRRSIHTLLVALLVLHLTRTSQPSGHQPILDRRWESCRRLAIPLP